MRPAGHFTLPENVLYAYYDRSDAWHARAVALIRDEAGGLIVPAPVIPEVDHLLGHRPGAKARLVFYRGLADGDYVIADLPIDRCERVVELNQRFADLDLGFVDGAVVAIAEATSVRRIATPGRRRRSKKNAGGACAPPAFSFQGSRSDDLVAVELHGSFLPNGDEAEQRRQRRRHARFHRTGGRFP